MHLSHFQRPSTRPLSRLVIAVVAVLATLTASGLTLAPAQAQTGQFVFTGAGWGHGVGMSQNGARNAAERGLDHVAILNHYYPNTIVSSTAPLGNIRVHLGDAQRVELSSAGSIVFERGGVAINAIPSGSITVSAHDGGLQIGDAWTTGSRTDPLYVSFPLPVKLANNGHSYLWGRLQITNRDGKVRVVEDIPLEQYVAGIAEMPAAWPLEALMAQAIAARTYAHEVTLHRRASSEWAQEYDISGTTVDQNYIGYDAQDSQWDQKWLAAVSATAGVEIIDSNGPIRAYYSASNGGYTETADYVFSNNQPSTVAGPDPYDAGGHDWTSWTRTYSQESISRWFNAHADTSVGTLNAINVLGGAGQSARLDKAVVELVGSNGTKRVTGRRMMIVMNAGIFGEGGGLSTHLPGTFTTIGNGASAGAPQPGGQQIPAAVTPDPGPDAEVVDENADYVPPPGWEPDPGTGVPPGVGVPPGEAAAPATGEGSATEPAAETSAQEPAAGEAGFVPPADWVPEPGTGVPPGSPVAPGADVPAGDPVPPGQPVAPLTQPATLDDFGGFTPPDDWVPEAGTGVAPTSQDAGVEDAPAQAAETATAVTAEPQAGSDAAAAAPAAAPAPDTAEASDDTAAVSASSTAGSYTPPEGWQPDEGTGVPPGAPQVPVSRDRGAEAAAGGVLLVTRTANSASLTETTFEVIAPNDELAAEARARLEELQAKAALGLFAEVDIDGYVSAVAPRPVHAVCTAAPNGGVTCVPLEALTDDD